MPVEWAEGYLEGHHGPGDHALHLLGWNGQYADPDNFVGPLFGENTGEFGYQPAGLSKIARAGACRTARSGRRSTRPSTRRSPPRSPRCRIAFPISALALSARVLKYPASPVLNEVFNKVAS